MPGTRPGMTESGEVYRLGKRALLAYFAATLRIGE
jgi:hypothetical protein